MTLRANYPYVAFLIFIVLTFALGGGARGDVQSLILLRPLAVLALVVGLWGFARSDLARFRYPFGLMLACLALALLHLVPLPPAIWTALPGRDLAEQVSAATGLAETWRPLSLVPYRTWNAAFALLVPIAAMVLAIRCAREERFGLLAVIIALGLLSGFLGLLQAVGPREGPLYFYRITNFGSAVGLFANRNHQAALLACLFPMLAVFASRARSIEQARRREWFAICAGAVLVPLILVTGSRAGLLLALLGLASVPLLYRRPHLVHPAKRKVRRFNPRYLIGAGAIVGLGLMTVLMSRARAFERLLAGNEIEELRFSIWGPILKMVWSYFPVGSGLGTFVEIYEIDEPRALMIPSYVNHAHNDWLEILLAGGLPALILLVLAIAFWARASWRAFHHAEPQSRDVRFARLGAVIIGLLGVASFVDYPLRAPSLAMMFAIAAIWLAAGTARPPAGRRDGEREELMAADRGGEPLSAPS